MTQPRFFVRSRAMLRSAQPIHLETRAATLGPAPRALRESSLPANPAISAERLVNQELGMDPSSRHAARFCSSEVLAPCEG